ncbi:TetR/AcrR family transcriptional regulator [Paragemmobacter straminiformis]|uniref:TetR/AcrR family transcriptional regulator n=1 Tax=Paragemmobacter straminiformis TaxID=2045119 RepID=A0A842I9D3_9RHOB|nr:TetR/AcrR family transcriptional regulator [Gemmobacter straminiformis]MBC2835977.1 TetR/AcrR family transcriptional regulator [Gemmobacter straminiformis]
MTGLRERQKAHRTRRILETSSQLFRQVGYGAVRIDDIARAAEISVGTFYNYFETKGDLLLAIVSMEVEEVHDFGKTLLADPPADVARALARLIGGYYDHSLVYLSKEMWRTAMAITIEAPATRFSTRFTDLDRMLTDQVCALLAELQRRAVVRPDIDTRALGEVVFNNLNAMFIEFVKDDAMTLPQLNDCVARQNAPLAALISC